MVTSTSKRLFCSLAVGVDRDAIAEKLIVKKAVDDGHSVDNFDCIHADSLEFDRQDPMAAVV